MTVQAAEPPEHRVIEVRRHWVAVGLWWRVAIVVLLCGALVAVLVRAAPASYLWLPLITLVVSASLVVLAIPVLDWFTFRVLLTDRRLTIAAGLVRPRARTVLLEQVRDVVVNVDRAGKVLGYGTILVTYQAEPWEQIVLDGIPEPEVVRGLLMEYARRASPPEHAPSWPTDARTVRPEVDYSA